MRKLTIEEIKERLERAVFYYGRTPSQREVSKFISHTVLVERFGTYNRALDELDYPVYAYKSVRNYHSLHSRYKKWLRDEARATHGNVCRVCKNTERLHVNHVVPYRWSHSNAMDNLEVLCVRCHAKKEARRKIAAERWFYRKFVERWPKQIEFPDV